MISLMIRIVRQIRHDPRSLAMLLAAPLLLLGLLYLLLGESNWQPTLACSGLPSALVAELAEQDVTLVDAPSENLSEIDTFLADGGADAYVSYSSSGLEIRMIEADSTKSAKIMTALRLASANAMPQGSMTLTTLYGDPDASMFTDMSYIFLGVLAFFFVYIIAGIAFVRERTTGTLERLMMTPIRRWQIVGGYFLGFGIFSTIQSVLAILFARYVLGLETRGPLPAAMLVMILLSLAAVAMGALVSSFAGNEFQVVQTIPIIIVPQIFFTGLIPIDTLPYGLGNLAYIMPVYYGCTGLKSVLIRGAGIEGIIGSLAALVGFVIVLFLANTLVLKKYRRT